MEQPDFSVNTYISYIRQQISMLGANDSEFSRLDDILKRFNNGEISEEESKIEAKQVLESKQDYH